MYSLDVGRRKPKTSVETRKRRTQRDARIAEVEGRGDLGLTKYDRQSIHRWHGDSLLVLNPLP
jgi:hypothetical protein